MIKREDEELVARYTERWVMDHVFVKTNIIPCLKKMGKADQFEVVDEQSRETHIISAKKVHHFAAWRACLCREKEIDTGCYRTVQRRVKLYKEYLLQKSPYLLITEEDDFSKLDEMIIFSAIIRTTEARYATRRIVDAEVRSRVATLLAQREHNAGMAQAAGHARKHGEDVAGAIESVYQKGLEKIDELSRLTEWQEPLPLLPEGSMHTLAWLEEGGASER